MKKTILGIILLTASLFADMNVPKILSDNNFEAYEYQLFVTNTRNIEITKELNSKLVYEGSADDYFKEFEEMNKKELYSLRASGNALLNNGDKVFNAIRFNDMKSLQNLGITSIGLVLLNPVLYALLGDDVYIQVKDYFKDGVKVTRLIKYLISDDSLDKEDYDIVFNTTNSDSHHFRSGGIFNSTQKKYLKD